MKEQQNSHRESVRIDFITYSDGVISVEGRSFAGESLSLVCRSKSEAKNYRPQKKGPHASDDGFTFTIEPSPGPATLQLVDTEANHGPLILQTGLFTGLSYRAMSYTTLGPLILFKKKKSILATPRRWYKIVGFELLFLLRVLFDWRLDAVRRAMRRTRQSDFRALSAKAKAIQLLKPLLIIGEAIVMIPRAFVLRASYFIAKPFKRRPLWIISDRIMAAGDNGEALFRYSMAQKADVDIYFALSRKSADYRRIAGVGPVLDPHSLWYKLKFLMADKVVSSHADIEVTSPFLRQAPHFANLLKFDFVFLQHGITRHDMTDWLNRYEKNIQLFITAGRKEYDSILTLPYYYSKDKVLLGGFPRYDYLENKPKGKLIIAPTYRASLVNTETNRDGMRGYDPHFKHTEYFKFYNKLLGEDRILQALRKNTMTAEFYLHPNFSAQSVDFTQNELVSLPPYPYSYRRAFAEGNLLVSDYSSVVFDFAYLEKPVIYTKFDEDEFYAGHTYSKSDFFHDEDDGFGKVTRTYDELVDAIVSSIESGCVMEAKYKQRVRNFFYKHDQYNSKRVYDAIRYNKSR